MLTISQPTNPITGYIEKIFMIHSKTLICKKKTERKWLKQFAEGHITTKFDLKIVNI